MFYRNLFDGYDLYVYNTRNNQIVRELRDSIVEMLQDLEISKSEVTEKTKRRIEYIQNSLYSTKDVSRLKSMFNDVVSLKHIVEKEIEEHKMEEVDTEENCEKMVAEIKDCLDGLDEERNEDEYGVVKLMYKYALYNMQLGLTQDVKMVYDSFKSKFGRLQNK